jgi:hypothetical protein
MPKYKEAYDHATTIIAELLEEIRIQRNLIVILQGVEEE